MLALFASGCAEEGETTTISTDEGEIEVTVPEDADESCPVGTSWQATNPQTGETVSMVVVGTEVVDSIEMCKAVYESTIPEDEVARVEYLWSEDPEAFMWTAYDSSGNVVSEMSMRDGMITIVGEDGTVIEYSTE